MSALPAPSRLDGAPRTKRRLELNHRRNLDQDHTAKLDAAAKAFDWVACRDQRWNPEELSLLWGTRLWDQASETQRLRLN
ncbi:MAG: P-aminobenzoate N-oxygenase AurF, partial [Myxococcota bacterium]